MELRPHKYGEGSGVTALNTDSSATIPTFRNSRVHICTSFKMPSADAKPRTLYDKVFQDHIVDERDDGTILLYIGQSSVILNSHERPTNTYDRQAPCA